MQTAEKQAHGTLVQQWYELLPERLIQERGLVASSYPEFQFSFDAKGNTQWEGLIKLDPKFGACSFSAVQVRITCLPTYPRTVPYILDVERKLSNEHVESTGRICLENRYTTDPLCIYTEKRRIRDTINSLHDFLVLHWLWVQDGSDPEGQLHGELAFIDYELRTGCHPLDSDCLCGREDEKYEQCCYPNVVKRIRQWQPMAFRKQRGYEKCNCGSGKTYRKCGGKRHCHQIRYCHPENPFREDFILLIQQMKEEQASGKKRT